MRKTIRHYAVAVVAHRYRHMRNPTEHAEHLLETKAQLWAYLDVIALLRADGERATFARRDEIWFALGGALPTTPPPGPAKRAGRRRTAAKPGDGRPAATPPPGLAARRDTAAP